MLKIPALLLAVLLLGIIACSNQQTTAQPTELSDAANVNAPTPGSLSQAAPAAQNPTNVPVTQQPDQTDSSATNLDPASPTSIPPVAELLKRTETPTPLPTQVDTTTQPDAESATENDSQAITPSSELQNCDAALKTIEDDQASNGNPAPLAEIYRLCSDQVQNTRKSPFLFPHNEDEDQRYTKETIGFRQLNRIKIPDQKHPYEDLFPRRSYVLSQARKENETYAQYRQYGIWSATMNVGLESWVNSPWFKFIPIDDFFYENHNRAHRFTARYDFAPNSIMDEVRSALTEAFEEAGNNDPIALSMQFDEVANGYDPTFSEGESPYKFENLGNYLATPILKQGTIVGDYNYTLPYEPPSIHWEFIHEKLPIIQVTAWGKICLIADLQECEDDMTEYVVSFVVTLQERSWVTDPDQSFGYDYRPINRAPEAFTATNNPGERFKAIRDQVLGEDVAKSDRPYQEEDGADPDPKNNYANKWHHTDYMHHSIVGEIRVQIKPPDKEWERFDQPNQDQKWTWHNRGNFIPDQFFELDRYLRAIGNPQDKHQPTWCDKPIDPAVYPARFMRYSPNLGFPLPGNYIWNSTTRHDSNSCYDQDDILELQDYLASWNSSN